MIGVVVIRLVGMALNSVTSQNGIEKHLIARHCHVLVQRGYDHTPIEPMCHILVTW